MKTSFSVITLLLVSTLAQAEVWTGKADITFDGTSTLHSWGGKVSAQPFKADVTMAGATPQQVVSTVIVKATQMDTAEAKRDEKMRESMQVTSHPLIQGEINAKFSEIAPSGTPTKLPLTLTLLGKPQKVDATLSNWKLSGKKATFDLDFDLSLKKSGITVPTMLVFIKVGDTIKVHASVSLNQL